MDSPFALELAPAQVQELEQVRDHHPKAYVRVKAAGILKVWSGTSRRQVARSGLLKPVRRETVQQWIVRYQQEGVAGLLVKAGRGRKPAFSPCADPGAGRRRGARGGASQPTPLRPRTR
jgi:Helix-turn-helix domain